MNIEQLTCTIGQAKKLNELGVTAPSQWVVVLKKDGSIEAYCYRRDDGFIVNPENNARYNTWPKDAILHLYTLGELMRMAAPDSQVVYRWYSDINYWNWFVNDGKVAMGGRFNNPEQAAADMLIHQLEKGYITPEQCNAALGQKGGQ